MNRTAVLSSPWLLCRRQFVGRHRLRQCCRRIAAANRKVVASIYLKLDEPSIAVRIGQGTHHYISAALLLSQAETSESPAVAPLHGSVARTLIGLRRSVCDTKSRWCSARDALSMFRQQKRGRDERS